MNFASDNITGASQKVLDAIVAANSGNLSGYGTDTYSLRAEKLLCDLFERDCQVFFVATGTAANALALGAVTPAWGAVFCHDDSHIMEEECGAPEFFTGGAKLAGIGGTAAKISPDGLRAALARFPRGNPRQVQPASLSLSQATEAGTLYSCAKITALSAIAHDAGLRVHMDGARFANALTALRCTAAEMTWKAGIDVLSFGASKNGLLAGEAVVFFDPAPAANFKYQRKRGGHLLSKSRFFGAQFCAYLEDGHWLGLARHANERAAELAAALAQVPGVRLVWPVEANEIFAVLPAKVDAALRQAGGHYHPWSARCVPQADLPKGDEVFIRLVASFATRTEDVAKFAEIAANA